MEYLDRAALRKEMNRLATANIPFLFLVDFKGEKGLALELSSLKEQRISCAIDGEELGFVAPQRVTTLNMESTPMPFEQYCDGFDKIIKGIRHGDAYLLNLTYPTLLKGTIDLPSIYHSAAAPYKFMIEGSFLFYSPEPFIRISDNRITSFPMKGTIAATDDEAQMRLINNHKELYEHYTIVDLIRNDLAMVSTHVEVEEFRYVERIATAKGEILQTSSRISGLLPQNWHTQLGDLLLTLLPAGSISGAPKERCLQLIEEAEIADRGFYTGVMGVYRDYGVNSCVNIRFVERTAEEHFYYRSGGGITALSNAREEYDELIAKIYVPIH